MKIRKAIDQDKGEILKVMKPWNMHHVPSLEMANLDISCFFVATIDNKIIGASGYKILSDEIGKTTLLGVIPEFKGKGIGKILQEIRLKAMYELGVKKVITNADRPSTIRWYKKNYGYYEIGKLKKLVSFGDESIDSWTTLEMNLVEYMKKI